MDINELILLYVVGAITRKHLEQSLQDVGFTSQIIAIHMKRADVLLQQTRERETEIDAIVCDGGSVAV